MKDFFFDNVENVKVKISSNNIKEIKNLIKNSKEFLYIVSPYVTDYLIEELVSEKYLNNLKDKSQCLIPKEKNIDIKLLFTVKTDDLKGKNKNIFDTISYLYHYDNIQDYEIEKIEYLKENEKYKKRLSYFTLFFSVIFSLSIFSLITLLLGIIFFKENEFLLKILNFLKFDSPKRYLIIAGSFLIIFFIWLYTFLKYCNISEKEKMDLKRIKENSIPNVSLPKNLELLCLPNETKPFIHSKIYLSENQLILGSANFTYSGLNKNIETLIIIEDYKIIEEMRKYCLTLFKNETLIENSIQEEKMKILLYNYFYIVHKEDY